MPNLLQPLAVKSHSRSSHLYFVMASLETVYGFAAGDLPTAPVSPASEASVANAKSPLGLSAYRHDLPTPPTSSSSASSTRHASADAREGGANWLDGRNLVSRRPSSARVRSGNLVIPLRTRRYTSSQHGPLNVTINPAVHASHLSNPTSRRSSTAPTSPIEDPCSFSAFSSLTSNLLSIKLTDGVASPPAKNTPPLTPRALSNDGSETIRNSSSPSGQRESKHTQSDTSDQTNSRPAPPIPPPKGKLYVKISSARGLKPSISPYAVCSFEWIESIAHEPQNDEPEYDDVSRGKESEGGVPIRRGGRDMGKPIAIPMKSRQSSNTSASEQKDFKNETLVTDPRWDHEAVLYASLTSPIKL